MGDIWHPPTTMPQVMQAHFNSRVYLWHFFLCCYYFWCVTLKGSLYKPRNKCWKPVFFGWYTDSDPKTSIYHVCCSGHLQISNITEMCWDTLEGQTANYKKICDITLMIGSLSGLLSKILKSSLMSLIFLLLPEKPWKVIKMFFNNDWEYRKVCIYTLYKSTVCIDHLFVIFEVIHHIYSAVCYS